jgi:S-adenosylmethionine synthetase
VQVAYAIGVAEPVSINCETFGTGRYTASELTGHIRDVFDLRPDKIIEHLGLRRPIYRKTAAYGHFGRDLPDFRWEKLDKVEELKAAGRVQAR